MDQTISVLEDGHYPSNTIVVSFQKPQYKKTDHTGKTPNNHTPKKKKNTPPHPCLSHDMKHQEKCIPTPTSKTTSPPYAKNNYEGENTQTTHTNNPPHNPYSPVINISSTLF
jgi:hypothetical protein